jgi:5-methylcytosine-specific restriction endonuclease McrA
MERECTKCKELKGIENYYWENTRQRYQNICKSCIKTKSEIRYIQKRDIINIKNKEWINNNKEKFKALIKKNRGNYKEYDKEYAIVYHQHKRKTDPTYRLKHNLRNRFYKTITNKTNSVFEYLGCTVEECKLHLSSQFKPGMEWENYGGYWEIDHIIPIYSFDLTQQDEIHKCWNYKNLQPLTINENRTKSNKQ